MTTTVPRTTVRLHARDGLPAVLLELPLTAGQLDGWDCITCGRPQAPGMPFVPVGSAGDDRHRQVFACAGHNR